ncbi:VWA domain-containing protein [Amycolatopsis acidicola]|uniref:VWA domain-containing protein n=1 Tax=Amycolatopsis acidicola TaxID=2596893 RepID=A0A5N0USN8_9PSEU|nr:VWA domain-containing protein [Amycolatopsis acidicola]
MALVLVLGAASWVTVALTTRDDGCPVTDVVHIAATPEVAGVVAETGEQVAAGQCFRFEVDRRDSAAVAQSLSTSDGTRRPDVWIPDSTVRLRETNTAGAADVPESGSSVASSPVVFALTEQAAKSLGWPGKQPSWPALLASSITMGMVDPSQDPVGISALLGAQKALPPGADPVAGSAAALRRLSPITLPGVDDLYARLPGAGGSKQSIGALPASEASVLNYNSRNSMVATGDQLVAAYPPKPVPSLDFPFAVLNNAGDAQRVAAAKLLRALQAPEAQQAFAAAGLRTPDGRTLISRPGDTHVTSPDQPLAAIPSDDDLTAALNQWAKVNLSSRARVLIDVSGSMNAVVPGSGGKTRMQLTADAAARALNLFKPTSELGAWIFSTNLDGDKDYREILPMSTISAQLAAGAPDRLRALKATPNGQTGLYDSVLAAYRTARREWQAGRLNLVIVMTDGRNEDSHGITREQLLAELAKLQDPRRPLPIIGIGLGTGVDPGELRAITAATGGHTFVASDPAKISDVFYGALAGLACATPSCS